MLPFDTFPPGMDELTTKALYRLMEQAKDLLIVDVHINIQPADVDTNEGRKMVIHGSYQSKQPEIIFPTDPENSFKTTTKASPIRFFEVDATLKDSDMFFNYKNYHKDN